MYWEIGRRIVEEIQQAAPRASYATELLQKLSQYLAAHGERGFSLTNLKYMREFYRAYPAKELVRLDISWTHYQRLLRLDTDAQRRFYEDQILRQGWSVQELEHNIYSLLYERTLGHPEKQTPPPTQKQYSEALPAFNILRNKHHRRPENTMKYFRQRKRSKIRFF